MDDFSLVPVDHQPDFSNVSLVPVEGDPFGVGGVNQQTVAQATRTVPAPSLQPPPASTQPPEPQPRQPVAVADQPSTSTPGVPATESARPSSYDSITAGANDFFRSIPRGIVSGFNTAGSALARATQAEMGQDVDAPTPEQATEILEKHVTGPMHKPEGSAGKFGASAGEFLGNPSSYVAPGSLLFKVGAAALGGLGSEAGGQLGEGTSLEVPFRILGGVLGGVGAARLGTGERAAETALTTENPVAGRAAGVIEKEVAPAAAATNAPDGNFYSVLFEHKLRPTSYLGKRPAHTREANEAFLLAMENDDAFARNMQDLGVKLQRTRTGLAPRRPPAGFSWHHAEEPGVMQLVPRSQHDQGSIFQHILHPAGRGGYSKWGKEPGLIKLVERLA
jgi:hypothetical protein